MQSSACVEAASGIIVFACDRVLVECLVLISWLIPVHLESFLTSMATYVGRKICFASGTDTAGNPRGAVKTGEGRQWSRSREEVESNVRGERAWTTCGSVT
jgi:hypothetical protein